MKQINGFVIFSLILTFGYFIGLLKFLSENEEDKCEMTYMFEYPQYVKISNKADKEFSKYGLYAYSEGRHTERTRNMYFNGIPVLFIPGNAGSHKQVRSLSSIALRKWLNSRTSFHFDYFTVDLNEEYSGLYGPLLFDQLQYVNASLYRILELYENQQYRPESVVVIGHSMGGVIAMKLLAELQQPNLIPIVITLASPLKRPLLNLDYHMNRFYEGIYDIRINMTTMVSVSGGYSDFLIAPFMTEQTETGIIHALSTNIPISWTECNHVQILWCKQIVLALNRALFDSVDVKTHQISTNGSHRDMIFKHHLVKHSGTKIKNRANYFKSVEMNPNGKWIEDVRKSYSIEHPNGINQPHWYMIALTDLVGYGVVSILGINLEVTDWVFVCNAYFLKGSSRVCREGFHLSHKSEIAPSVKYKRRFFHINMEKLKKNRKDLSHIVFRALPTDEPLEFHVDVHGQDQRLITVNLPYWFSLANQVVVERTAEKALYYELALPDLNHIKQYYRLLVEPMECSKNEHHASITLTVPWGNQDYHGFLTNNMKKPFNIRLYSSKPTELQNETVVIKLILDPSCTYKISIQSSIFGILGQLSRSYTPLLLANIAAVALLCLRYQLKNLKKGYCSILFVAIQEGAKLYFVIPAYKILSRLLSFTCMPSFLIIPDAVQLVNDEIDFLLLPPLLFLCSVGLFWLLVMAFSISLIAMESTIHKLSLKLLARTVSFNMAWSDYVMSYLHKVPVVVALTLISLSLTTCGGLALCLGAIFYFLRLTQMSQDFVEEIVWYIVKKLRKKCKTFFTKNRTKNKTGNHKSLISIQENKEKNQNVQLQLTDIKTNESNKDTQKTEKVINEETVENETGIKTNETNKVTKKAEEDKVDSITINENDTVDPKNNNNSIGKQTKTNKTDKDAQETEENKVNLITVNTNTFLDKGTETNLSLGIQVNEEDAASNQNTKEEFQIDETTKDSDDKNLVQNSDGDKIVNKKILNTEKTDESNKINFKIINDSNSLEIIENDTKSTKNLIKKKETDGNRSKDSKNSDEGPELSSAYNAIFFHSTLFFLWCIITVINVPAVLTWAHNFKYTTVLEPDDSFIPGLALSICALTLWQCDFPKINRKWTDELTRFILVMAIFSVVFGMVSIYRLNYLLTITLIIVILHQLFAPQGEEQEEIKEEHEEPEERAKYSDLKMKME